MYFRSSEVLLIDKIHENVNYIVILVSSNFLFDDIYCVSYDFQWSHCLIFWFEYFQNFIGIVLSHFIIIHLLQTPEEEAILAKKRSKKVQKKYETRQKTAKVEAALEEQFQTGRLLGKLNSSLFKSFIIFVFMMRNLKRVHTL